MRDPLKQALHQRHDRADAIGRLCTAETTAAAVGDELIEFVSPHLASPYPVARAGFPGSRAFANDGPQDRLPPTLRTHQRQFTPIAPRSPRAWPVERDSPGKRCAAGERVQSLALQHEGPILTPLRNPYAGYSEASLRRVPGLTSVTAEVRVSVKGLARAVTNGAWALPRWRAGHPIPVAPELVPVASARPPDMTGTNKRQLRYACAVAHRGQRRRAARSDRNRPQRKKHVPRTDAWGSSASSRHGRAKTPRSHGLGCSARVSCVQPRATAQRRHAPCPRSLRAKVHRLAAEQDSGGLVERSGDITVSTAADPERLNDATQANRDVGSRGLAGDAFPRAPRGRRLDRLADVDARTPRMAADPRIGRRTFSRTAAAHWSGRARRVSGLPRLGAALPDGQRSSALWAWYMGNGTPLGAIGDFLAAIVTPNVGGGNHIANHVESQVIDWCKEIVGLPPGASGLLASGGSMANLIGLNIARNSATDVDLRTLGLRALPASLTFYASTEAHSCLQKGVEMLGLGSQSLRRVPVDSAYKIDVAALAAMIEADRRQGLLPACVIGNAGTVNTGAVDDLAALASLCSREKVWFHVDGAIGAVVSLAPRHRHLVDGIAAADSVVLDLHKWLHVPFEAGCILVRDRVAHRAAFALTPEYLEHTARGLASGPLWFSEYGPQLSRGFRALKVWLSFKEHGLDKFGRLIDQNIAQAHELAGLIKADPVFELMAPVELNIVCFRYRTERVPQEQLNAFNEELLVRLHESGIAAPSYTKLGGQYCLRAAIANHRTDSHDLRVMVGALKKIAGTMLADQD